MQSISARSRYRNTFWCLIHTAQEEGLTALWRGSTMRLCRLSLSGAVVFTIVSLNQPFLCTLLQLLTSSVLLIKSQYEEVVSLAGNSS